MPERLKIRFLTVIWGTRYIEEFARVSLPSYLAPGNLPALAQEADLEVLVLTSKESREGFDLEPTFGTLREICPVRFLYIDDLITTGVYGVTLTLAYARGIMASGPDQTNTHFIFMNSDFVLGDGSLRCLLERLKQGCHCVMAPSLRVRSEDAVPALAASVRDHQLALQRRELVALALNSLHPTVVAKTVTQGFITCATHNQIYWQVDAGTLLGRCHLIFMLAIKPEVPMHSVNSYCDYGFVPELVPSGEFTILGDSDEFMMLEIQSAEQEKTMLRCGSTSAASIARELSNWTTREHRRFAEVDVVFHSGETPSNLPEARAEASRFVAEIHSSMSPIKPHVDHFYWRMGLQSWATLKYAGQKGPRWLPPEVFWPQRSARWHWLRRSARTAAEPSRESVQINTPWSLRDAYLRLIGQVREWAGVFPNVPIWHHLWLDSRILLRWLDAQAAFPRKHNALICEKTSTLATTLPNRMPIEVTVGLNAFLQAREAEREKGAVRDFDTILVQVTRPNISQAKAILEHVHQFLAPDGVLGLFIRHENAELDPSDFNQELSHSVEQVLPSDWLGWNIGAEFTGGRVKRRLRVTERLLFRYLVPSSVLRLPLLIISLGAWPVVAALTALNNYRTRNLTTVQIYCTSALLSFSRRSVPRTFREGAVARPVRIDQEHSPVAGVPP